jgi:putative tryptophan/tyrosine transport system substrate-binding protein
MSDMRRREFVTLLGSAAAAWPLAARAQQNEGVRRIGVLMPLAEDDAEGQARLTAFLQGLRELGWTDGRNVRIDTRWTAGQPDEIRKYAAEFAALAPEAILAAATPIVAALQPMTQPYRSCSCWSPIRSPRASSTVSRGRAATSQGS